METTFNIVLTDALPDMPQARVHVCGTAGDFSPKLNDVSVQRAEEIVNSDIIQFNEWAVGSSMEIWLSASSLFWGEGNLAGTISIREPDLILNAPKIGGSMLPLYHCINAQIPEIP